MVVGGGSEGLAIISTSADDSALLSVGKLVDVVVCDFSDLFVEFGADLADVPEDISEFFSDDALALGPLVVSTEELGVGFSNFSDFAVELEAEIGEGFWTSGTCTWVDGGGGCIVLVVVEGISAGTILIGSCGTAGLSVFRVVGGLTEFRVCVLGNGGVEVRVVVTSHEGFSCWIMGRVRTPIIPPIRIAGNPPIRTILRKKEISSFDRGVWQRPFRGRLGTLTIPRDSVSTFNHKLRSQAPIVEKNISINPRRKLIPLVRVDNASRTISWIGAGWKKANEKVPSLLPSRQ